MHKRGNSLLENLFIFGFYLILAVIIYLILSTIISGKSFSENYLVRDIGLTIDVLHNSPGQVNVEYLSLNDINLVIKENYVEISSLNKLMPKIYAFTRDKNYKQLEYDLNLINTNLKLNKEKNYIYLQATENK
jgi:uncharacterized membrane protein